MKINGVNWYTKGMAHVPVFFPEDKVCCANCLSFCRYEDAFHRYSCRGLQADNHILRPMDGILPNCPITFEQEDK